VITSLVLYSEREDLWKIADFGLMSEGTSNQLLSTTAARGTPGYRAPEMVKDVDNRYNNKVDIWSMGCILYEFVVGQRPFLNDYAVIMYSQSREVLEIHIGITTNDRLRAALSSCILNMLERESVLRAAARDLCRRLAVYCQLDQSDALPVTARVVPPDGESIFATSSDGYFAFSPSKSPDECVRSEIVVFDAQKILVKHILYCTTDQDVTALAFGKLLGQPLLGSSDSAGNRIDLWEVHTGDRLCTYQLPSSLPFILLMAFPAESGDRFGIGMSDGSIKIVRLEHATLASRPLVSEGPSFDPLPTEGGYISALKFHLDNIRICSIYRERNLEPDALCMFDSIQGTKLYQLELGSSYDWIWNASVIPIGLNVSEIFLATSDGFESRAVEDGRSLRRLKTGKATMCCTVSLCGNFVVTGHPDFVRIWHQSSDKPVHKIKLTASHLWFCHRTRSSLCIMSLEENGNYQLSVFDFEAVRRDFELQRIQEAIE
jgi:hypothetical protein